MTDVRPNDMLQRSASESPSVFWYRVVSAAGVAIVLLLALIQSFGAQPLQYRSLYWLIAAVILVPITIRFVFRDSWRALIQTPDLLIPFGIAWFASKALTWLALLPYVGRFFLIGWQGNVVGVPLTVSSQVIFNGIVWSAFASWQIELIWQYLRHDRIIDISLWPPIRRGFWRAFSILILGHGVLLLAIIPALAAGIFGFLILGILWNVLTVALMPVAISGSPTLIQGIRDGLFTSWKMKQNWWIQLGTQLMMLGIMTYVWAIDQEGGRYLSESSFAVSAFWVGAFENDFRWHSKYMAMIHVAPLPWAVAVLEMLFILLAISMKIYVIKRLPVDSEVAQ